MSYVVNENRYDGVAYRQCGRSGLTLPPISLGTWLNFGGVNVFETFRGVIRRAFDRGVTHFDCANMYGPPNGSAEENLGRILAQDFRSVRDELVISTKAGYEMWPGPYGIGASRKHLVASLDQSLKRLGVDYVDIFYVHRPWPEVPMEETMATLAQLVKQGKALYVGVSSYSPERTRKAHELLQLEGVPLLVHQPSYSMLNRHIEDGLLDALGELGIGCIGFSPLAQGMLTSKYINGDGSSGRAGSGVTFSRDFLSEENLTKVRGLADIAKRRSQSLAQMAIAWVLRDPRVTSALIGARTVAQLDDSLDALNQTEFSADELDEIDRYATESGIDFWRDISSL
ncbi:aldo/keto reductase [Mycobacterium sp. 1482292.6]|uniref:aldo/keto reductase n=1 Tax=unclassified Mycobacterium TaxID=2642494 RepID=UPI0007FEEBEA|nr:MULTISPECIES: aldo/keto reductase [unclassified Mycobacterium]OBJ12667.1 aldo/keto reductase [Mycobacterium sp. 1482292.6]OBJ22729.1 aldo/keto reductase [Mycobacterium sp. 1245801.1]